MNVLAAHQEAASLSTHKVVMLLVLSGFAAISSICAGAVVVYFKTQHLVEARDWLDHTQTVLATLQAENQRLERVDGGLQLYRATGDEVHLRTALKMAAMLDAGVLQLRDLVRDNRSQTRHVEDLRAAIKTFSQALGDDTALHVTPEQAQRACQAIVNVMLEEERQLLQLRTEESHESLSRSLLTGAGYLAFSVTMVCVLFGFLIRDALQRSSHAALLSGINRELASAFEEQTRQSSEAALLVKARDELQLCVSLAQAHKSIVRHFETLLPGSRGATLTINNSRRMVEITECWKSPESLLDGFELEACCGLRAGRVRWRTPGLSEVHCTHFVGAAPESYLCMPMAAHGETLGFIYVECPTAEIAARAKNTTSLLNEMVELASMAIASLNLKTRLENYSIHDGLTNLFNRRFMEGALERELHRVRRRESPLALMMIDVDHFKIFNDTFGHEAGDAVLREVAECLRQTARAEDIVCRFGGEEFVIILPEITIDVARGRAELIRRKVNEIQLHFRGEPLRKISVSVGLSLYPEMGATGDDLIRRADQALYRAKAMGRDQVQTDEALFLVADAVA